MTVTAPPVPADRVLPIRSTWTVARAVAADRVSRVVFAALAVLVTFAYTIVLPFASTQRLSLANWQFLTGRLLGFAVALGVGIAIVLTVQLHAVRRAFTLRRTAADGAGSGLALLTGLLPTFLCCTPIIPTVLAGVGVSTLSVYTTTRSLQHFFAVHETAFFAASLGLLALTGWRSLRQVARATCTTDAGCTTPAALTRQKERR